MRVLVPLSQSFIDNESSLIHLFLSLKGYGKRVENTKVDVENTKSSLQKFQDAFSAFSGENSVESSESRESSEFSSFEESIYANPPLTISYENYKTSSQESSFEQALSAENVEKQRPQPVIGFV